MCLIGVGIGKGAEVFSFDFLEGFLTIRMKESNLHAARTDDNT
jgi:hypothetical protein